MDGQGNSGQRVPVAVLGATGIVGQNLLALMSNHPWMQVVAIAASDTHAGISYGDAVRWALHEELPDNLLGMVMSRPDPKEISAPIVFSALPASAARILEPTFAQSGAWVFSNASAFRMATDVPLIVPEINSDHLAMIPRQQALRNWPGAIVANPNCSTIGVALSLTPLKRFKPTKVAVTTLQAASGAGVPGVPSLMLLDNVIPFIPYEEGKIETEIGKILGSISEDTKEVLPLDELMISATCMRVPIRDGHMFSVLMEVSGQPTADELIAAWRSFSSEPQTFELPSAPQYPLVYRHDDDRPQPILDRFAGSGMTVTLGRLRSCVTMGFKYVGLVHNTIRGAAGAALLNAELAISRGLIASQYARNAAFRVDDNR